MVSIQQNTDGYQAPFQWAAIFHKKDINFTNGHHDLAWYDPTEKDISHHLPCKVGCAYCKTPIMDEGRNMILLYPTLVDGINTEEAKKAFRPSSHIFYPRRVIDIRDGLFKWKGLDNSSDLLDEDDNVLIEFKDGMDSKEMEKRKREVQAGNTDGQLKKKQKI